MEVSAGIVRRRQDGRVLACQRGAGKANAHLWEFPGGKRERGETAEDCLQRELKEELSLPVTDVRIAGEGEAQGIHFTFLTAWTDREPVRTEHEACRFLRPRELLSLPFCPADTAVARALALNDPPLRAFLWDFDGTVMDTYPALSLAMVHAAGVCGIPLTAARALELIKRSVPEAVETLARENGVAEARLMAAVQAEDDPTIFDDTGPVAGIPETLAALRAQGGRHILVTHHDLSCLGMLEKTGLLGLFDGWVTREDGLPRKPEPDMVRFALEKFRIPPEEAVMIGDRPLDTLAGQRAGILTCLLDEEGRFPDAPCDLRTQTAVGMDTLLCPPPIL